MNRLDMHWELIRGVGAPKILRMYWQSALQGSRRPKSDVNEKKSRSER